MLIDLTHIFTDDMPVYPGDSCARLYQTFSVEKDGVANHTVETGMHVGTHIDAPMHMIAGGACICDIPLARCRGRGVVIDARGHDVIDAKLLHGDDLKTGDIVLVWTGWSDKFRDADYYGPYPVISDDFARACVEAGVVMVGMDTPSPDREPFPVHKILLGAGVLITENLTNLAALAGSAPFTVRAYPMNYKADAAPARVVAEMADNC